MRLTMLVELIILTLAILSTTTIVAERLRDHPPTLKDQPRTGAERDANKFIFQIILENN